MIRERGNPTSEAEWGSRVEVWVDARDTADVALLDQRGDETLAEAGLTAGLTIDPVDTPGREFGTDYWLGDRVSVDIGGNRYTDLISRARVIVDANGERWSPTIGDPEISGESTALYGRVKDIGRRLGQIERRQ